MFVIFHYHRFVEREHPVENFCEIERAEERKRGKKRKEEKEKEEVIYENNIKKNPKKIDNG